MDPQRFWGNETQPSATATAPAGEPTGAPAANPPGAATMPAAGVGTFPTGQQAEQPQESEAERAVREAQERAQRAEARANQLSGTLSQVEQWAQAQTQAQQRQQAQAQYDRRHAEIWQTARNMGTDDAFAHAEQKTRELQQELWQRFDQIEQQANERVAQVARQFATPLWAQELARQHGLPPEGVQELLGYGDPEVMARQAPIVAARYTRMRDYEDRLNQLARSQQAGNLVRQGAGLAGGQQAANLPLPESDDPDVRAMQILAAIRAGTYSRQ